MKKGIWLLLAIVMMILGAREGVSALTCSDLDGAYVYSQESTPKYLGFFGSAYATESIMNTYGTYCRWSWHNVPKMVTKSVPPLKHLW